MQLEKRRLQLDLLMANPCLRAPGDPKPSSCRRDGNHQIKNQQAAHTKSLEKRKSYSRIDYASVLVIEFYDNSIKRSFTRRQTTVGQILTLYIRIYRSNITAELSPLAGSTPTTAGRQLGSQAFYVPPNLFLSFSFSTFFEFSRGGEELLLPPITRTNLACIYPQTGANSNSKSSRQQTFEILKRPFQALEKIS